MGLAALFDPPSGDTPKNGLSSPFVRYARNDHHHHQRSAGPEADCLGRRGPHANALPGAAARELIYEHGAQYTNNEQTARLLELSGGS